MGRGLRQEAEITPRLGRTFRGWISISLLRTPSRFGSRRCAPSYDRTVYLICLLACLSVHLRIPHVRPPRAWADGAARSFHKFYLFSTPG